MRRRHFAAPWLVVVACGPARAPAPAEPEELYVAPPPITVYRAARPDEVAPPPPPRPAAPPPAEIPPDECRDPARAYREHGTLCNPPDVRRVEGAVIDVAVTADGTVLTISLGSADGVDPGDHAVLLDDARRKVPNGDFVIVRVTQHAAVGKVKLARDRVTSRVQVELR